jgi:lipoate-protein ligase A
MREWNPPCFALENVDAVQTDGRKLIGSAQVRRHGALLQHGSIALRRPSRERLLLLYTGTPGGEARFLEELESRIASTLAIDPDALISRLIPEFQQLVTGVTPLSAISSRRPAAAGRDPPA